MNDRRASPSDEEFGRIKPRQWWIFLEMTEPLTLSELVTRSALAESSVRQHLRALRSHGLIEVDPHSTSDPRYRRCMHLSAPQEDRARQLISRYGLAPAKVQYAHTRTPITPPAPSSEPPTEPPTPSYERSKKSHHGWLFISLLMACVLGATAISVTRDGESENLSTANPGEGAVNAPSPDPAIKRQAAQRHAKKACRLVEVEVNRPEGPIYFELRDAVEGDARHRRLMGDLCPTWFERTQALLREVEPEHPQVGNPTPYGSDSDPPEPSQSPDPYAPQNDCEAIHDYYNDEWDAGRISEVQYDQLLDELFETCYANLP